MPNHERTQISLVFPGLRLARVRYLRSFVVKKRGMGMAAHPS
jgi:hypothetical protein